MSVYEVIKTALYNGDTYQMNPIKGQSYFGEIVDRSEEGYGKGKNDAAIQIHVGGLYFNTAIQRDKYASSSGCMTLNGSNAGDTGRDEFFADLQTRIESLQAAGQSTEIKVEFLE